MSDIEREKMPVLLSIRSEQLYEDSNLEPDGVELMTGGTMELTPQGMILSYEESSLTGMEGTTTSIEIRGPQVILSRTGTVNSQMVFEQGRQHTSLYETPFGDMAMDIQTSVLKHNLTENGGVMEIRYSITVQSTVSGRSHLKLRVKRRRQS